MKKPFNNYIYLFIGIVPVLGSSCSSQETDSSKFITNQQEIVINEFNVEQSRGQLLQSANASSYSTEQKTLYRTAKEVRSAVSVETRIFQKTQNTPVDCASVVETSSGTLVSDSRILTSHHAVFPRDNDSPFQITFESVGGFYTEIENHPTELPNEEIPFLSRRLFGLGLDQWSTKGLLGLDARDRLRTWDVELDNEKTSQEGVFMSFDASIKGYEGLDVSILKIKGNSMENEYAPSFSFDTPIQIKSGPFLLRKAGPFFDRVSTRQYREFDNPDCELKNTTGIYAYHMNTWPDEEAKVSITSLISNPGYKADVFFDSCNVDWNDSGQELCLNDKDLGYIDYQNCILTSLDVRAASSGGSMMGKRTCINKDADGIVPVKYQFDNLYSKGVIQSIIGLPGNPLTLWLKDIQQTDIGLELDEIGQESFTFEDATIGTLVTANSSEVVRWTNRDVNFNDTLGDPFDPAPDQPPEQVEPDCSGADDGEPCHTYEYEVQANSLYGESSGAPNGSDETGTIPSDEAANNPEDQSRQRYTAPTPPDTGYRRRFATCHFNAPLADKEYANLVYDPYKFRYPHGMFIGFMGSASLTEIPRDGENIAHLADFFGICTPWSSAPWINNWGFVHVSGVRQTLENATAYMPTGVIKFYDVLRRFYELRDVRENPEDEAVIRPHPPSFKTCPPNYYLEGLEVHTGIYKPMEDDIPKILGVKALNCRRIQSNYNNIQSEFGSKWADSTDPDTGELIQHMPEYLSVETNALIKNEPQDGGGCCADVDYRLGGLSFPLNMNIGSPIPQLPSVDWSTMDTHTINCEPVEIGESTYPATIVGMEFNHHANGLIDKLNLWCSIAPGLVP